MSGREEHAGGEGDRGLKHRATAGTAWGAAALCALAGAAVFQWFGNANHGYIDTRSLFWWWGFQWFNPASETQHGLLVLAISAGLLWRNVRKEARGERRLENWEGGKSENAEGETQRIEQEARKPGEGPEIWKSGKLENAEGGGPGAATPSSPSTRRGRRVPRNFEATSALASSLWPLALAFGLHAIGFAAQQARISIVALLLFTWGVLRLGGGRRWGAAAAFPLAFLVFAIPLNVLDSVGFWLRLWVIQASTGLAHAVGIGVVPNGTQLTAPDGRYQYDVAAACSGVRSLMALAALSLLIGYLNFRAWWRRGLLLLLCFPLVYVGNVARIAAIIVAAQAGGPRWGDVAHAVMGWAIFGIVLGGVLGAAAALRRWRPERGEGREVRGQRAEIRGQESEEAGCGDPALQANQRDEGVASPETNPAGSVTPPYNEPVADDSGEGVGRGLSPTPSVGRKARPTFNSTAARAYGVGAVVVVLAAGEMLLLHHLVTRPEAGEVGIALAADGRNPVELPALLGRDWVGLPAPVTAIEREILPPDTGYSRMQYVATRGGARVFLSIVLSGRDRTSIHRPELCLVGQGWTLTGSGRHVFAYPGATDADFPATLLHVRRREVTPGGAREVPQLVAYWFVSGDRVVATHWQRLAVDAWNRVVHGRADRWAYVLMQTDANDGEAAALARLQAVLIATLPAFQGVHPKKS